MSWNKLEGVVVALHLLCKLRLLQLALAPLLRRLEELAVRVRREPHRLDGVAVQLQAERRARVERLLRLVRRVHVEDILGLDEAAVVVDRRVDDAIADRLCDDVLGVVGAVELQAGGDVRQRDARVRQADAADARLDDIVPQAENEGVCVVALEACGVLLDDRVEVGHVADTHGLGQVKVRQERAAQRGRAEERALGNVAEEHLDDHSKLVCRLEEADGGSGRLAGGLQQVAVRCRVLELDCIDAAQIVEVASRLAVCCVLREGCLGNQQVCLLDEVVVQVVAEKRVGQRHLAELVLAQGRRAQRVQERAADGRCGAVELVRAS
eukprot:m.226921 g.226921  ORF g.226921 m.226921 type:complete len:324 (+) comp11502_c0_seq1:36-1007(+)